MNDLRLWLELRRWRAAGQTARLWWRDDDATGSAPARDGLLLERLAKVSADTGTPLVLAVVPAGELSVLAKRLEGAATVTVVQHGVDHQNRREGAVAGEFPQDWSQPQLQEALASGWSRMATLPRAMKVFAPPWNDVHPLLERALRANGYVGWSANGTVASSGTCCRLDAHLDLLRWRGGARFRGRGKLLGAFAAELRRRRLSGLWDAPIGLLTHHLAHDDEAWAFLGDFLRWTKARPQLSWVSLPELMSETQLRRAQALRRSSARPPVGLALAHPA
jgi:hypothetical protein